jgi:hypothetical protein
VSDDYLAFLAFLAFLVNLIKAFLEDATDTFFLGAGGKFAIILPVLNIDFVSLGAMFLGALLLTVRLATLLVGTFLTILNTSLLLWLEPTLFPNFH